MTVPALAAPAAPVVANAIRIVIQAGGGYTIAAEVTGAGAFAAGASTLILATGGAAAVALAGYGLYKWLEK